MSHPHFMIHFKGAPYSNELYDVKGRNVYGLEMAIEEATAQYPYDEFEVYNGIEAWKTPGFHGKSRWQQPRRRKNPTKRMGKSGKIILNDRERELWVINDEVLYNWWKSSRLPMRKFLRTYRAELDAILISSQMRDADRPSGYGQYPRSY